MSNRDARTDYKFNARLPQNLLCKLNYQILANLGWSGSYYLVPNPNIFIGVFLSVTSDMKPSDVNQLALANSTNS